MRLQTYMIEVTRHAMTEAFRYAKSVPEDKLNWKPLDLGRSVLEQAQELAKCPDWAIEVMTGQGMELEAGDTAAEEMASWDTVEKCEAACMEKLAHFFALVTAYPDSKLEETIDLPFGEDGADRTFTMAEMMDYPRWNATYHQGQIAYIQTLYGDNDNH